jgi:pimeloyl-ACP methyl ester carboxylesterase
MLAHREAGTAVNGNVLLLHGFPESSRMFEPVLEPIAQAGWRAVAPDLVGFGDSEPAGEELVGQLTPEAVDGLLRAVSAGMTDEALDDYTRVVSTPERRAAILELYRSGELSELAPYEGRLAALGVPTLLLWGADDPFAPVAGAQRCTEVLLSFLGRVASAG